MLTQQQTSPPQLLRSTEQSKFHKNTQGRGQHCRLQSENDVGLQIFLQSAEITANGKDRGGKQEMLETLALPFTALYFQGRVVKAAHMSHEKNVLESGGCDKKNIQYKTFFNPSKRKTKAAMFLFQPIV